MGGRHPFPHHHPGTCPHFAEGGNFTQVGSDGVTTPRLGRTTWSISPLHLSDSVNDGGSKGKIQIANGRLGHRPNPPSDAFYNPSVPPILLS
jgi:hypothetical protein